MFACIGSVDAMNTQSFPSRIAFCCLEPAASGGTTPVVDTAAVVAALRPAMRDRYAEYSGIILAQHFCVFGRQPVSAHHRHITATQLTKGCFRSTQAARARREIHSQPQYKAKLPQLGEAADLTTRSEPSHFQMQI
jgi:hypothetical protein